MALTEDSLRLFLWLRGFLAAEEGQSPTRMPKNGSVYPTGGEIRDGRPAHVFPPGSEETQR